MLFIITNSVTNEFRIRLKILCEKSIVLIRPFGVTCTQLLLVCQRIGSSSLVGVTSVRLSPFQTCPPALNDLCDWSQACKGAEIGLAHVHALIRCPDSAL